MLHILLLILKIIGIILAIILGILVLLICIVLFVPVCYEADAISKGTFDTLKAKGKVTWLFHLIRADVYFKERKLRWRIRIAWIKITGGQNYSDEEKEDTFDGQKDKETQKNPEVTQSEKLQKIEKADEEKKPEMFKKTEKAKESSGSEKIEKDGAQQKNVQKKSEEVTENREESDSKKHRKTQKFIEKIKKLYEKFKCTIKKICDKIKELSEKKEKVTEFVQDESHIGALTKVKKEAVNLMKTLKPKEFEAKAVVGFSDPQRTGQLLAILSVIYPFMGDSMDVTPDFEQKVFKGKIHIKGHLRVCHFVAIAIRLLLNKQIRTTYKDIKNFQL